MNVKISHTAEVQKFLEEASGLHNDAGSPRTKALIYRILRDSVNIIEDLAVTPEEFWKAVNYLNVLGARQEAGLVVAGLGLEHYLDLLMDAEDEQAGKSGGTPRTIEGPLYVAGAPLSQGEARLDDGVDPGVTLFMQGRVFNTAGEPLAGAVVDVWHANTGGTYSYFDPTQSEFNLRRRRRRPLPFPQHRAVGLWLPTGRSDPATARSTGPSWPAPGARALLHFRAGPSPPDHPDQPGW